MDEIYRYIRMVFCIFISCVWYILFCLHGGFAMIYENCLCTYNDGHLFFCVKFDTEGIEIETPDSIFLVCKSDVKKLKFFGVGDRLGYSNETFIIDKIYMEEEKILVINERNRNCSFIDKQHLIFYCPLQPMGYLPTYIPREWYPKQVDEVKTNEGKTNCAWCGKPTIKNGYNETVCSNWKVCGH